jgi:hypothetical protein
MYRILNFVAFLVVFLSTASMVSAQKWQAGSFTDSKGNKVTGFIRVNPTSRGPIKDEGYIEFKDDEKTNPYKLSASDLKSFTVGQDSFVVAHAPHNSTWSKKELDFVQVELDEETKLFVAVVGMASDPGASAPIRRAAWESAPADTAERAAVLR